MKAEERKALERNVLVDQLNRAYEGIKQGPSRSTAVYVGIIVVGLAVFFLFRWFSRSSEASASERWLKVDEVVFPEQLDFVAQDDKLKDTPQGQLIRLREARRKLSQGLRDLAANPATAQENIELARATYQDADLLKWARKVPVMHQEALLGAAKANEALGDVDEAVQLYKRLIDEYPQSDLAKEATKQRDRLETEAGRKEATELSRKLLKPSPK